MWDILDDVIRGTPCSSTAPTLPPPRHPGVRAAVEGKAIQLHWPVARSAPTSTATRLAVHLPLGAEKARAEGPHLMLSTNNILKPSDGRPIAVPSRDMIVEIAALTSNPIASVGRRRTKTATCGPMLLSRAGGPGGVRRRQPGPERDACANRRHRAPGLGAARLGEAATG